MKKHSNRNTQCAAIVFSLLLVCGHVTHAVADIRANTLFGRLRGGIASSLADINANTLFGSRLRSDVQDIPSVLYNVYAPDTDITPLLSYLGKAGNTAQLRIEHAADSSVESAISSAVGDVSSQLVRIATVYGKEGADKGVEYVKEHPLQIIIIIAVGGVLIIAAPAMISAAGFGEAGVEAGSLAAWIQSSVYGAETGGIFSVLQSAGASGLGLEVEMLVGLVGGGIGYTVTALLDKYDVGEKATATVQHVSGKLDYAKEKVGVAWEYTKDKTKQVSDWIHKQTSSGEKLAIHHKVALCGAAMVLLLCA